MLAMFVRRSSYVSMFKNLCFSCLHNNLDTVEQQLSFTDQTQLVQMEAKDVLFNGFALACSLRSVFNFSLTCHN